MTPINPNWPIGAWNAAFNQNPNDPTSTPLWSDFTPRVIEWGTTAGTTYELGQVEAGTATLTVADKDEAFNPANPSSPYNDGTLRRLIPYRPIRNWQMWPQAGNIINSTNAVWGISPDDSNFDSGHIGSWLAVGTSPPGLVGDGVIFHDGPYSMRILWPTYSGPVGVGGGFQYGSGTYGGATYGSSNAPAALLNLPPTKVGVQYTVSAWVKVSSGPTVQLTISPSGFTSAASSGSAFQRMTITFVATDVETSLALFATAATTAGNQVNIDSIQMEVGGSATTFGLTGPTIYPVHTGYIERYPNSWTAAGFHGWAKLTSVDALGLLPRATLDDELTADIGQDGPRASYPLTDPVGTFRPAPAAASIDKFLAKFIQVGGKDSANPVFGQDGAGFGVEGDTVAETVPLSSTSFTYIYCPTNFFGGFQPSDGFGVTFEVFLRTNTTPSATVVAFAANGTSGHTFDMGMDNQGNLFIRTTSNPVGPVYAYTLKTSGYDYADGSWHQLVGVESTSGSVTTGTLYVDGQFVTSTTRTASFPFVAFGFNLGATGCPFLQEPWFGDLARGTGYGYNLSAARIASHYRASTTGFYGEKAGQRIKRLLAWAKWNGPTSIGDGHTAVEVAQGLQNVSLADAIQQCLVTDNSALLTEPSGILTVIDRDTYYLQTHSSLTFGEAETPYEDSIQWDMDPSYIQNVVSVSRPGNQIPQQAKDSTSQMEFFPLSLTVTSSAVNDNDTLAFAQHLLNRYKDARLRVSSIQISPSTNPALWPAALSSYFGQRVTVKRRTTPVTMSADFYIINIKHDVTPTDWTTTFEMAPVEPFQAWLLGDATYGVLGSTTFVAY